MPLQSKASNFERLRGLVFNPQSTAAHYWVAIAAVALLLLLRIELGPWLHAHGEFLLFIAATLLAAGVGGLGPGFVRVAPV